MMKTWSWLGVALAVTVVALAPAAHADETQSAQATASIGDRVRVAVGARRAEKASSDEARVSQLVTRSERAVIDAKGEQRLARAQLPAAKQNDAEAHAAYQEAHADYIWKSSKGLGTLAADARAVMNREAKRWSATSSELAKVERIANGEGVRAAVTKLGAAHDLRRQAATRSQYANDRLEAARTGGQRPTPPNDTLTRRELNSQVRSLDRQLRASK